MLSRRRVIAGGIGLLAVGLDGCAGAPSRPVRFPATSETVADPGSFGLNAVIDMHHNNPVHNLKTARTISGILGVIHKASEGVGWMDPRYKERRIQARSAGLLWGAYHFGTYQHSGTEQAEAFLAAARPDDSTVLALDLELNERSPGNSMRLGQAEDFVHTLNAATGRMPLLYIQPVWADGKPVGGSSRTLGGRIGPDSSLAACDLWLADYRSRPELPSAWAGRGWRLWQYAGDGHAGRNSPFGAYARSVSGVGHCDRNLFNGNEDDLRHYWERGA
ncbi:MAG: glycoside hydrolase family 25 protein [Alphaproteobacteria bacterium]|nr:glycoside hydrolase family 25 protein [Alphaproteobacteria bacterium]